MKKIIFFSMLIAIGVSAYANPSVVINENNNSNTIINVDEKASEEMYTCEANCLLGSCSVSCPAPESGGGGGAACTCAGGFPNCACGEEHGGTDSDKIEDVSISNVHLDNIINVSSISSTFVSSYVVKFHNLIEMSIKRGTYKKSRNKVDIQRFVNLRKTFSRLSNDEKQKLDDFLR